MSALPGGEYTGRAYCLVVIAILSGYTAIWSLHCLGAARPEHSEEHLVRMQILAEYRSGLPDQAVANLFLRLL